MTIYLTLVLGGLVVNFLSLYFAVVDYKKETGKIPKRAKNLAIGALVLFPIAPIFLIYAFLPWTAIKQAFYREFNK